MNRAAGDNEQVTSPQGDFCNVVYLHFRLPASQIHCAAHRGTNDYRVLVGHRSALGGHFSVSLGHLRYQVVNICTCPQNNGRVNLRIQV